MPRNIKPSPPGLDIHQVFIMCILMIMLILLVFGLFH
jgi:hypothetical protein